MEYYRLLEDMTLSDRWYLSDIQHVDNWLFRAPPVELMEPCSYSGSIHMRGAPLDFTLNEIYGVPIVTSGFVDTVKGLDEVKEPYHNLVFSPVAYFCQREHSILRSVNTSTAVIADGQLFTLSVHARSITAFFLRKDSPDNLSV